MIARRVLLAGLVTPMLLALPGVAAAQPARRVARVGWLGWSGAALGRQATVPLEALRAGLQAHGWKEGVDLALIVRFGERAQARQLASELVAAKVDVIVAQGPMVFGARIPGDPTPLVFAINGDPVEAGLVTSLARPGADTTGITALNLALAGKRLELLIETRPGITRVAVLANAVHPGLQAELRETRNAAERLGLTLQYLPVSAAEDFPTAFDAIARDGTHAVLAFPDTLINAQARVIAGFAEQHRLPSISGWAEFAQAGNLMSYGPNLRAFFGHLAGPVHRLLQGAKPADLPVEQPTTFGVALNLKTARALGLTIPQSLLLRADEVIG